MIGLLPKWLTRRYLLLWSKFKDRGFGYNEAQKLLGDKDEVLSVALSNLKKAGYLTIQIDPNDSRKRIYRLEEPEKMLNKTINEIKRQ